MVEYEDHPQEHIKHTSTCGAVLTENNLETGRKTPVQPRLVKKDLHGVRYEEKQSNQVGTSVPRWGHRRRGDYTGTKILPGERLVRTTYWVPQPSPGTGKTSPLAGLKIRRAVGNLDSASEELTHICYSREQGRGSRLKLPRMLAGFP